MPIIDQISKASEISLKPTVNHHIIKNGFNALKIIPEKTGPYLGWIFCELLFVRFLICNPAKQKRAIAPKIEIISSNLGKLTREKTPKPNNNTRGSSIIVWPCAIFIPAFVFSFNPYTTVDAKRGPGDNTPDAEITITDTAKYQISCIVGNLQKKNDAFIYTLNF